MRVRSINPNQQAKSLWDEINDPNKKSYYADPATRKIVESIDEEALYSCYSEADAAEDMVLFPDELTSTDRNVPFKEISNPTTVFETAPATVLQFLSEGAKRTKDDIPDAPETTIWSLPRIWEDALEILNNRPIDFSKTQLLQKVGLLQGVYGRIGGSVGMGGDMLSRIKQADSLEVMEKDRGAGKFS